MPDPTEAISAVKGASIQGQAAIAIAPKPSGSPSGGSPSTNDAPPRHDTVEISDAARAVSNQGGGYVAQAPKGDSDPGTKGKTASNNGQGQGTVAQKPSGGRAPDGDATKAPDGDADDMHFNYDPKTNTLQTQVISGKTGKPVVEIPSDEQIRMKENLQKFLSREQASAQDSGNGKR